MKSYEWMVDYTPQATWIEGHGIFIWLAEVFGALGGGLYIVALYFDSAWGLFIGWLMVIAIKGGLHMAHLGQPSRFWRLVLKPGSSWLARGIVFVALFGLFGALQLILSYWSPGTVWEILFKIPAGILALLVAAYSGFVMNYVNGIPFWNSALLPLLFITFGIMGGSALIMLIGLLGQDGELIAALGFAPILLVAALFLQALYLWTATYMGPAAKRSVTELIQGRLALPFWAGVVLCGATIPVAATLYILLVAYASASLIAVIAAGMLVDVFSFNYCLLKGGFYRPLTPIAR